MRNFTEFSPGYALANITITEALADQPLSELRLKQRYDVTGVAVEKEDEFQNVYPETVLAEGENIIVAGPAERVDEFANRVSYRRRTQDRHLPAHKMIGACSNRKRGRAIWFRPS